MTILWGVIVGNDIVSANVSHNSDTSHKNKINYAKFKGAVSWNSAKILGNYKMPVKLRETKM